MLEAVSTRALLVAPVRIGLGVAGLAAARISGAEPSSAGLAFVVSAFGLILVAYNDPRRHLHRLPEHADPVPAGARRASAVRMLGRSLVPSTVGVAVLLAVTLPSRETLAAVLAGVLAGMGVAALGFGAALRLRERQDGVRLLADPRTGRLYAEPLRPDSSSTASRNTSV